MTTSQPTFLFQMKDCCGCHSPNEVFTFRYNTITKRACGIIYIYIRIYCYNIVLIHAYNWIITLTYKMGM